MHHGNKVVKENDWNTIFLFDSDVSGVNEGTEINWWDNHNYLF